MLEIGVFSQTADSLAAIERMSRVRSALTRKVAAAVTLGGLAALVSAPIDAASLRPTRGSLDRQNNEARRHDFTYLQSSAQVIRYAELGYLIRVPDGPDYQLKEVSFPYARPEVKMFIERLAEQYREACGDQLVVTSLTRPKNRQPYNASRRSVHPTGMALDLRRPWSRVCRGWLEHTLVTLEAKGVLEATLERSPPHYHIALFPKPYDRYVDQLRHAPVENTYMVMRGDTLWRIAQRHNTTIEHVKRENGLRSSRIYPGQILQVPSAP